MWEVLFQSVEKYFMVITVLKKFESRFNDSHLVFRANEAFSKERIADDSTLFTFSTIPSQQFVENINERMETYIEPRKLEKKRNGRRMVIFDSTCENGS
jgi:hypothetical protein